MKVCLTEQEVQSIVLEHVKRFFPEANKVTLSAYTADFCRVTNEKREDEDGVAEG